jgi:uncharacterized protein DUF6152
MTRTIRIATVGLACSVLIAVGTPARAHHSAAAFDTQKTVTVTGRILQYSFANPHIYIVLQVQKEGASATMEVEAGAASVLNGLGFTKTALSVGEVVTIVGNPARKDPDKLMLGKDLYKRDGDYIPLNIASRSIYEANKNKTATSIAGTWFSPRTEFNAFLGSSRNWSLTEKGKAAAASADPTVTTQKDCVPIGAPALMFYPVANTIDVQRDRVVMTIDWMESERVVYLDGRKHPPAAQTSLQGHSVGRWEGKTLVVETANFKEHPNGLSMTLPGSAQKRLTEKLTLGEDGRSLLYSGTIEDPVYLAQPVQWSGKWEYRPTMPHSNQKCDVEVARKYLRD